MCDVCVCREKGRVVGGTKGNFILEYVSGAPNKERIIDRVPNVFDYDELTKYGFSVSQVKSSQTVSQVIFSINQS